MKSRSRLWLRATGLAFALAAGLGAMAASAQEYPSQDIRLVCAFPAGSGVDVIGRAVAAAISQQVGQTSVVINRDGAAGTLGFATLAAAMTPYFSSPLRDEAIKFPVLVAYVTRMFDRFYPDFEWDAGINEIQKAA